MTMTEVGLKKWCLRHSYLHVRKLKGLSLAENKSWQEYSIAKKERICREYIYIQADIYSHKTYLCARFQVYLVNDWFVLFCLTKKACQQLAVISSQKASLAQEPQHRGQHQCLVPPKHIKSWRQLEGSVGHLKQGIL